MNNIKENDWLVASLNNSEYSEADFHNVGLTAENTQLLDKESYKKSQYIQDKFTNDEGNFDEALFNKTYDVIAQRYQNFVNNQYESDVFKTMSYDAFNGLRPNEGKIAQPSVTFDVINNPQKLKTGISSVGFTDNPQYSVASLAESSAVYNYAELKYEKYTPNDLALFESPVNFIKSLVQPLVLAQWEEDGTHIDQWSGRTVHHKKGDYKLNEDGNYYYETLDSRDPYGKQFRTVFDNITSENSKLNPYDFFDSNDLTKTTTGAVTKLVAQVAPLFIPGVDVAYGYMLVGSTLADVVPGLYKASIGVVYDNDELEKTMNSLQGFGKTLRPGLSDEGKRKMLGIENIAGIISDVALQWSQQRAIFKLTNKFTRTDALIEEAATTAQKEAIEYAASHGGQKVIDEALKMSNIIQQGKLAPLLKAKNRVGADVALGYMAMMQGLETYNDAIAQGATKEQAAIWTWGAIAGMYAVDRTGLGELFFPELKEQEGQTINKVVKDLGSEINKGFGTTLKTTTKDAKGLAKLWNKGKEASEGFWRDVQSHSTTFVEKAIGEGLEEVAEELCVDLAKATNNVFYDLGWKPDSWVRLDAFQNAGERYAANFFGGAVGGAVFAGVDLHQNLKNSKQSNEELIYLLRNGKKDEVLKELEVWKNNGLLGNKDLSATNGSTVVVDEKTGEKKFVWNTGTQEDNQNDATYKMMVSYINALDQAININGLNLSDPDVLEKMMMGDERIKRLLNFDSENSLMQDGYKGTMLKDWNHVAEQIIQQDARISDYKKQYSDPEKRRDPSYEEGLNKLLQDKQKYLDLRDKFLDGTYSKYYLEQTLFNINTSVNKFFFAPNFSVYAEFLYGKAYADLTEAEITEAKSKYESYVSSTKIEKAEKAFQMFNWVQKQMADDIGKEGENYEIYQQYKKFINGGFKDWAAYNMAVQQVLNKDLEGLGETLKTNEGYDLNPRTSEDYELYKLPDAKLENETDEQFNERVENVKAHNELALSNLTSLIEKIKATGYIDDDIKQELLHKIGYFTAINNAIKSVTNQNLLFLSENNEAYTKAIKDIQEAKNIEDLKNTLENFKLILNTLDFDSLILKASENPVSLNMFFDDEQPFDPTYPEDVDRLKDIINSNFNAIFNELEQIIHNPQLQLGEELLSLKMNPLNRLIDKFSVNLYGEKLSIFDLLKREKGNLRNSTSVSDYVLNTLATKEIDQANALLNMINAVINAASTDRDEFGHNAILVDFIKKYFPAENLPGILKDSIVAGLAEDLNIYRSDLQFLKELSDINKINQFGEQSRTGVKVMKLMGSSLINKLKNFGSYKGISLLDGIENLDLTALTDSNINDSKAVYMQTTQLEHLIYSNFQKMKSLGEDVSAIIEAICDETTRNKIFNRRVLFDQKTSKLNSNIKSVTDYDVFVYLMATLAQDRNQFNANLYNVLSDPNIAFAPLINLLIGARIIVAQHTDDGAAVFNAFLNQLYKGDQLHRTSFIDGIGGAGKTSVVAYLVQELLKQQNKNLIVWKSGPTDNLVLNLKTALGDDGEFMTADNLLARFLNPDTISKLQEYIRTANEDNDIYKINSKNGGYKEIVISDSLPINNVMGKPDIIFIDEATYQNTIYYKILSKIAKQLNIQIVLVGDLVQNGVIDYNLKIGNIHPLSCRMVRVPKLEISMRISNTLKKDNIQNTLILINKTDTEAIADAIQYSNPNTERHIAASQAQKLAMQAFEEEKRQFELHYYEDEENLNGEKVVASVTEKDLDKLTANGTSLGLVYDNTESDTYKLVSLYKQNHPDANIDLFTKELVQGTERTYFIIDVAFDEATNATKLSKTLNNFYTMITRSKKGTLMVDKGVSNIFKKNIKDPSTGESPDPKEIIAKYKEQFYGELKEVVEQNPVGNAPLIKPHLAKNIEEAKEAVSEIPQTTESLKENARIQLFDETSGEKAEDKEYKIIKVEDNNITLKNTSDPSIEISKSIDEVSEGLGKRWMVTELPKEEEKVDNSIITKEVTINDEQRVTPTSYVEAVVNEDENSEQFTKIVDTIDHPYDAPATSVVSEEESIKETEGLNLSDAIKDVRVYGFYLRPGCKITYDGKKTLYRKENTLKDSKGNPIEDDLNFFMLSDQTYTEDTINTPLHRLEVVREFIQSGAWKKVTQAQLGLILTDQSEALGDMPYSFSKSDTPAFTNGSFAIRIKEYKSDYDKAQWKNGYRAKEEKGNQKSYNLVFRCQLFGVNAEFTLGTLPKPATWKEYAKLHKNDKGISKASVDTTNIDNYEKFYNSVKLKKNEVKYLEIPEPYISEDSCYTRVVKAQKGDILPSWATTKKIGENEILIFDFGKFKQAHPNALSSEPYIYAGLDSNSEISEFLKEKLSEERLAKLKGKAIAFVTAYPNIIPGITADNIAQKYVEQLRRNAPPLIRMLVLDPKGIYTFDEDSPFTNENSSKNKIPGFLDSGIITKEDNIFATHTSVTTAAKLFTTLWNYRAGLIRFNEILHREGATVESVNGEAKNAKLIFRTYESKDSANMFTHYMSGPTNKEQDALGYDKKFAVKLTKKGAEMQLAILDQMLKYIQALIPEAKSLQREHWIYSHAKEGDTEITQDKLIQTWRSSARNGENQVDLMFGEKGQPAEGTLKSLQATEAVTIALSKLIKISANDALYNSDYLITTTLHKGSSKEATLLLFDLGAAGGFMEAMQDIFADDVFREKNVRGNFIHSMFNLIFHGQCTIKKIKKEGIYGGYAPFPYGFQCRSRYKIRNQEDRQSHGNFFEAANVASDYTYDAVVEKGNYVITIPNGSNPEASDNAVLISRKKELDDFVSEINNTIFGGIFGENANIRSLIRDAEKKYEKEGDKALDNILTNLRKNIDEEILNSIPSITTTKNDVIIDYQNGEFKTWTLLSGISISNILSISTEGDNTFTITDNGGSITTITVDPETHTFTKTGAIKAGTNVAEIEKVNADGAIELEPIKNAQIERLEFAEKISKFRKAYDNFAESFIPMPGLIDVVNDLVELNIQADADSKSYVMLSDIIEIFNKYEGFQWMLKSWNKPAEEQNMESDAESVDDIFDDVFNNANTSIEEAADEFNIENIPESLQQDVSDFLNWATEKTNLIEEIICKI